MSSGTATASHAHSSTRPPRARLALRVGVTGHRPNKLDSAERGPLATQVRAVLEDLRQTTFRVHGIRDSEYLSDPPVLRIISPLAEGADRLIAEVAITDLGFELQCLLPFSRDAYEEDFETDESRLQFRRLLRLATSILELDGSRETPESQNQAYQAVGRMVLSQSDVMIAIWDGKTSSLRGGTSQIVEEANRLGIPVIWIDSKPPHSVNFKLDPDVHWLDRKRDSALFVDRIETLLMPPRKAGSNDSKKKLDSDLRETYFKETRRRWKLGFPWKAFRYLVALGTPAAAKIESRPPARLPSDVSDQIEMALGNHFGWADHLANSYADVYRSAFVLNYLMSACAVLLAFVGHWLHDQRNPLFHICYVGEVLIILLIILVTLFGTWRRWHARWIDYRLLAEHLRQTRFLMTLGRATISVPHLPAHVSYGDPRNSWMYWHLRSIVREVGIITARFDANYLEGVKNFVNEDGMKGQIRYHEPNAKRLEKVNERLHYLGIILFLSAFIAAFLHFFIHEEYWSAWLTLITIVGPAFGAALAAIRSQGEFERLAKRSKAMASQLKRVSNQLDRLIIREGDLSSLRLSEIASNAALLMVDEVLDWRIFFQQRPLDWPS